MLPAGSHQFVELQRWAGYLINVQLIHLSYLTESEDARLIAQPVKGFALRYEPEDARRVVALTRGHPFLTQLLCAEIVALKNEQPPADRRLASLADVEEAVPEALAHGGFIFADIERNQVDAAGLAYLRALARQAEGVVSVAGGLDGQSGACDGTIDRLVRRALLEPAGSGHRFQVELIRRWFAGR